jgi:hypothetical protein
MDAKGVISTTSGGTSHAHHIHVLGVPPTRIVDLRPGDYFDYVPTQERYTIAAMAV